MSPNPPVPVAGTASAWKEELELLQFYRAEIRFKSSLIAERVSALLSSQAFLVIAYAGSMSAFGAQPGRGALLVLPTLLTLLGLVLSSSAWPGIRAAHAVIDRWTARERELHAQCPALQPFNLGLDEASRRELARKSFEGSLFSRWAPFAFIVAWFCFGALPLWLYFSKE